MPILHSAFSAPWWLPGGHLQTLYPALMRRGCTLTRHTSTLSLPNGDVIELDMMYCSALARRKEPQPPKNAGYAVNGAFSGKHNNTPSPRGVVLLSHGMEGNSRRPYITATARLFLEAGWDCMARNCRGCGSQMNTQPGLYHSGQTEDIAACVALLQSMGYLRIALVGFSMGGNQLLKYLGEQGKNALPQIVAGVAFSAPCDLAGCAMELEKKENALYRANFLHTLQKKVRQKHAQYPNLYPLQGLGAITGFAEFDERYTAPLHGFASAADYWAKASSLPWLPAITVPTLMVSAQNDPFLSSSCFPHTLAKQNPHLFLEAPATGGHVGFALGWQNFWAEKRAVEFVQEIAAP